MKILGLYKYNDVRFNVHVSHLNLFLRFFYLQDRCQIMGGGGLQPKKTENYSKFQILLKFRQKKPKYRKKNRNTENTKLGRGFNPKRPKITASFRFWTGFFGLVTGALIFGWLDFLLKFRQKKTETVPRKYR